ncbi:MAG: KamA family radical SAM protein [Spirochaetales bacterium]|nr:KamA family radical SAM protein [Spirochaetales bacterium]
MKVKYINNPDNLPENTPSSALDAANKVDETYQFRSNSYYQSLINWDDPEDPIARLIMPDAAELNEWGKLDPSGEHNYTILPGLEHKYRSTALMLVSNVCGGICRYCFRKRVFMKGQDAILKDIDGAVSYIKEHKEITNVLLTGGDPLMLSTGKLRKYLEALAEIDHIKILRLGSKMPAFNPFRIIEDESLLDLLKEIIAKGKQIYIMTHFNHVQELTDEAKEGIRLLRSTGAELANQTPIIRGVNSTPDALANLFRELSFLGVPPYYIFQCRPASGNSDYAVPIEEGYGIFEKARVQVSGLAKRARFVMSHQTGKIEVVGMDGENIYMKYHRAAEEADSGAFMVLKRNAEAYWLDDYAEIHAKNPLDSLYHSYGPE